LAAELKANFDVDVELVSGSGGVFDVLVDEEVVYSKQSSGNKFPQNDALVEQINNIV
jgi:selT/selW/selH-like putative selenoprotein